MRVVIDTNIWVSGLLWKGDAWQVLKLAENGKVELCISYQMLLELEEVLAYERLQSRLSQLQQTPSQLAGFALSLATAYNVSRTGLPIVQADPDDDIFLLCAVEAQAAYVVSSDRHLLALKSYHDIPIITLAEFLAHTSSALSE